MARIRNSLFAFTVLGAVLLAACAPTPTSTASSPSSQSSEAPSKEADIVYRTVDGVELGLDACLPVGDEPAPAMLLLHGGGFVEGTRTGGSMGTLCEQFADRGYAAFSVSYRLVPDHTYPSQLEDVRAALAFLREPEQVEHFGIDPARIGALGSSAGAILALQAAMLGEGPLGEGERLGAVVSFSGVSDMSANAASLGNPSPEAAAVILAYLGCPSVTDCDGEAASPRHAVDASDPPVLQVTGEEEIVPVEQAEALKAALDEVGVANQLIILPGERHGISLLNDDVRRAVLDFLDAHL